MMGKGSAPSTNGRQFDYYCSRPNKITSWFYANIIYLFTYQEKNRSKKCFKYAYSQCQITAASLSPACVKRGEENERIKHFAWIFGIFYTLFYLKKVWWTTYD